MTREIKILVGDFLGQPIYCKLYTPEKQKHVLRDGVILKQRSNKYRGQRTFRKPRETKKIPK